MLSITFIFANPVTVIFVKDALTETGPSPWNNWSFAIFNGSIVPTCSNPSIPVTSSWKSPWIDSVEHFTKSGSANEQVFRKFAIFLW